ncbi:MAG: M28 family peptidase [Ignavibacteriaceae bacterium]|nr:M28 family peptidase [Ignavibacteriaceae bacterium]
MKKFILTLLLICTAQSFLHSQSPTVQTIINQTNLDSLVYFVKELSGEVATIINGSPYTIVSRHKNNASNDKAADYIKQKLGSYGLTTYDQWFSGTGRNVYGVQLGTEFPNQQYMICAHYDDMPLGTTAPGADDNGSGTAAVIEAARIFSNYSFPFTIIYALWDEEEQGLVGSVYYALQAANAGDSILGVLNMDMIAWDSNNDSVAELHVRPVSNSMILKDKMVEVNSAYNIGVNLSIINPGLTASDHSSFWNKNYSAILLIEQYYGDFNAYYHTVNDKLLYFNLPYFHKLSKLTIGTLATLALNLDLRIDHTPIASRDNADDILTNASIVTGLDIGSGTNAPRLYYRKNTGSGWSEFYSVDGTPVYDSGTYDFVIPDQSLGTIVQYYLAAQDENSAISVTLPMGGGGFSPPGSTPPTQFFQFYVAPMNIAFSDSTFNVSNWTSAGGWATTASKYTSAPYSFTDSPSGNYPVNTNATLTLNDNIDLSGFIGATLEFQAQWDIEADWDYGQLLISTNNGSTWTPMAGMYTNPGVGSFQPPGQPLYDGTQLTWVKESIDLSSYLGQQIKLRFMLKADGYIQADGWYVDDINIVAFEFVPTGTDPITEVVKDYSLEQNYPNPFNPTTEIEFLISEAGQTTLKVFDVLGNEVSILVNEQKAAGKYKLTFDASGLPSGVYFYTLQSGSFVSTKKMILLK